MLLTKGDIQLQAFWSALNDMRVSHKLGININYILIFKWSKKRFPSNLL